MPAPALTAATVAGLERAASNPHIRISVIAVPRKVPTTEPHHIQPSWARIDDGICFDISLDTFQTRTTPDGRRRLQTPALRQWKSLVERELAHPYALRAHSKIWLLQYKDLGSEARRDIANAPLSFEGHHARYYGGWIASARDVTTERVWETLHAPGHLSLKCSQRNEWFLIVERLSRSIRRSPVFKQPAAAAGAAAGAGGAAHASGSDDDSDGSDDDDETLGQRLLKCVPGKQLTGPQLDQFKKWLEQAAQQAYLINGGLCRTHADPAQLNWNTLTREAFYRAPALRLSVIQPSHMQHCVLLDKARFVGHLCPMLTATEIAQLQGRPPGNGSFFLISDEFLMTAFHCLLAPTDSPVPRKGWRWTPLAPTTLKYRCMLPQLLDQSFELDIANPDVLQFSSPAINWESPNGVPKRTYAPHIEYDVAILKLPASVTAALRALNLPSSAYIQLKPSALNGADSMLLQPDALKDELLQSLYVFGFPTENQHPVDAVGRPPLCITTRNNFIRILFHWELVYSCPTWAGMSGGPGLLADGTLVCMHRMCGPALGRQHAAEGRQLANSVHFGLRTDLFLRYRLPSRTTGRSDRVRAQALQRIVDNCALFYTTPPQRPRAPSAAMMDAAPAANPRQMQPIAAAAAAVAVAAAAPSTVIRSVADALLLDATAAAYLRQQLGM